MKILKKILVITLSIFILSAVIVLEGFVAEAQSRRIENFLFTMDNGKIISIPVSDYNLAKRGETPLYKYLKGTRYRPVRFGVSSGERYITTGNFKIQKRIENTISNAINNAKTIPESEFEKIYKIVGKIEEGREPTLEKVTPPAV